MSDNLRRIRATIRTAKYSESYSYNNDYRDSDLYGNDLKYYKKD